MEEYKELDPVFVTQNKIISENIASQEEIEAIIAKIDAEVDEALDFAEQSPYPLGSELYDDNYVQQDYPYITD